MERYSRQLIVLGLGIQQRLNELKILIAGCGALGTAVAELLARLGVKELTIVDADVVDITNLHRVHLFDENDVGKPKAEVCAKKISLINSSIKINYIIDILDEENVERLISDKDYVFDALDSLYYKLLLNDAIVKLGKILIYGGINGEYGSAKLIDPSQTSCLSCFIDYSDQDEIGNSCDVIGTTPLIVELTATLQVNLMLNHLRGNPDYSLFYIDSRELKIERINIEKNSQCKTCVLNEYPFLYQKISKPKCGIFRTNMKIPELDEPKVFKNLGNVTLCYPSIGCFEKRGR
ncbi:HesA/MoeB/ThiF family protein [Saccharolobus solfataricus]|uniref:HesA/MoeB/ThiF family protein n=2 Tax=Saccharolobus solfataricus TaxID=2287 RepID=A0A0E3MFU4_SACSO|nr:HesA/MoeB/ThiF family protein [Saccharolobus solfataricus]AKA76311.1 HesA/MoeB/ThiF family protein [Saccharolobus solfataricus]AKA79003.1 HesA/MoeB/ThiF family protein [Saccharolobus solfataricus]AZF68082.1 HesA/MoeB/ThiF family protein [Saccharolobus solfataricus]AZF70702.1 HesA/MoeB/ThiF family protein [Saccharolobus solfataricus]